ncbi:MAG: hypothetical protein JWM95_5493 [Gemmatimonadetes bacterium]|nr:hypothetical protein [Gemmatimonadota bacterium]
MKEFRAVMAVVMGVVVAVPASSRVQAQATVSGVVKDSAGRVLRGAEVVVDDPAARGITDESGRYVIRNVPPGERMLRARLLGYYSSADIVVVTGTTAPALDFVLRRNAVMLDTMRAVDKNDATRDRNDRNLLTAESLKGEHFETAYDALESKRSYWLAIRGPLSANVSGSDPRTGKAVVAAQAADQVWVYVDNVKAGGVEVLKTIPVRMLLALRRLDGVAATARYGVGHAGGVILVETMGESKP